MHLPPPMGCLTISPIVLSDLGNDCDAFFLAAILPLWDTVFLKAGSAQYQAVSNMFGDQDAENLADRYGSISNTRGVTRAADFERLSSRITGTRTK